MKLGGIMYDLSKYLQTVGPLDLELNRSDLKANNVHTMVHSVPTSGF